MKLEHTFEVLFCKRYQKLQITKVSCWICEKVNMSLFFVLFPVKVANMCLFTLSGATACFTTTTAACFCGNVDACQEFIFLSICVNYVSFAEEESVEVAA
jgi:hypothetical protein